MPTTDTPTTGTAEGDISSQSGALCWRLHRGQVELLLITSRETGRWVIPKGWGHSDLTAAGSAAAEAWEEAGVEGLLCEEPLGFFNYDKVLRPGVVKPCFVSVFALRVECLRAKYPERRERRRKWFCAARASRKVVEPELRKLMMALSSETALLEQLLARQDAVAAE